MTTKAPLVVIVGGGFGGLAAAKGLKRSPVDVLLIDRSNHHVFQPLLYQVATSVLAPGQIASPIRSLLADIRPYLQSQRSEAILQSAAQPGPPWSIPHGVSHVPNQILDVFAADLIRG